jgi:hypothetical protein
MGFLFSSIPKEIIALTAAGVHLASPKFRTEDLLALIDWPILVLFMGLFVVTGVFQAAGFSEQTAYWLAHGGVNLQSAPLLAVVTAVLSNLGLNLSPPPRLRRCLLSFEQLLVDLEPGSDGCRRLLLHSQQLCGSHEFCKRRWQRRWRDFLHAQQLHSCRELRHVGIGKQRHAFQHREQLRRLLQHWRQFQRGKP